MTKLHEEGHVIAKTFYVKVTSTVRQFAAERELFCKDLFDDRALRVVGSDLIDSFISADTYESEKTLTKTELARKLVNAGPAPFTVCYVKSRGQDRVLRGRLLEHEDLLGRSLVHDFDVEKGTPLREVDHRTLQWLIINGVKYTLKGKP